MQSRQTWRNISENPKKVRCGFSQPIFKGDKTPLPPHKKGGLGRYNH